MNILAMLLFLAHGLAHIVGFVGAFELATTRVPHGTTVLAGHLDVGEWGIRLVGVFWLMMAMCFVLAAAGAVVPVPWWPALGLASALGSLFLCVLEWPKARIGAWINLGIIALILAGIAFRWPIAG